jgi:hypothetical protein
MYVVFGVAALALVTVVLWYQGDSHTDPFTGRTVHEREINSTLIVSVMLGIIVIVPLNKIARATADQSSSPTGDLERLTKLRSAGALSESEFEAAKRRLLQ